jgi:hypothetical protein
MQSHTVYKKHKELLQSCYWKLKKNSNIKCRPCPLDYYLLASDTTLGKSPILQQKEFRSLISAMTIVKTLPRTSLHGAMGLCPKVMTPQ